MTRDDDAYQTIHASISRAIDFAATTVARCEIAPFRNSVARVLARLQWRNPLL